MIEKNYISKLDKMIMVAHIHRYAQGTKRGEKTKNKHTHNHPQTKKPYTDSKLPISVKISGTTNGLN